MSQKTRSYLSILWITNYKPTQLDFTNVWDSFFNLNDDNSDAITNGSSIPGSTVSDALNNLIPLSQKGISGGVATLNGAGKIPASQLPTSAMELQGDWDPSTNTPELEDGTGDPGDVYVVIEDGDIDLGSGEISFKVGDWVIYGASGIWFKQVNSEIIYERLNDFNDPYLYLAYAPMGTGTSEEVWPITRLEIFLDGSVEEKFANNVAWDDRLTVIYS